MLTKLGCLPEAFPKLCKNFISVFLIIFLKVKFDWYFLFEDTLSSTSNRVPSKVNMFSVEISKFPSSKS